MRFKQFLESESPIEKWEDLLHHIAEEELIACKVFTIQLKSNKDGKTVIKFTADCNDDPRELGYQADLSEKLTARLTKHKMKGFGQITAKVYHDNVDPR